MSNAVPLAKVCDHFKGVLGRDKVRRLVKAGHIKGQLVNGKYMVDKVSVQQFDAMLTGKKPFTLSDSKGVIINKTTIS